jgi:ubiquinone biosynthesis protein
LSEISFAQVLIRLFETARRFNMEIQPQLILLQKTLFNIEGLGRELYPQLDLWKTAHPVLRRWMEEQVGGRAVLESLRENLPQLRDALRELPVVIRMLAEQASRGKLQLRFESAELRELNRLMRFQQWQRFFVGAGVTATVCGTLLISLGPAVIPGSALLVTGIVSLWFSRPKNPR